MGIRSEDGQAGGATTCCIRSPSTAYLFRPTPASLRGSAHISPSLSTAGICGGSASDDPTCTASSRSACRTTSSDDVQSFTLCNLRHSVPTSAGRSKLALQRLWQDESYQRPDVRVSGLRADVTIFPCSPQWGDIVAVTTITLS